MKLPTPLKKETLKEKEEEAPVLRNNKPSAPAALGELLFAQLKAKPKKGEKPAPVKKAKEAELPQPSAATAAPIKLHKGKTRQEPKKKLSTLKKVCPESGI